MRKLISFIKRDHPYVYLSGAVLGALGIYMASTQPSELSFLGGAIYVPVAICALFILLAAVALVAKLSHWRNFNTTVFKTEKVMRCVRYASYVLWVAVLLIFIDRPLMSLTVITRDSAAATSMPKGFYRSMIYMLVKGSSMFKIGVWTTVRIALLGTLIAFVLSLIMVVLRIQEPDRRDNDLVKFLKTIGSSFAKIYITVIRGTPMMVQALIFYYAGFNIFKQTGMSVTEINQVWSFFISGLITVSLNSTAYLAEVLRGGIESIDHGQTEAARSLGMSQVQTMLKVVFPQAIKNSIPAIGNEFIINIKDSSVLSVIGCMDLMYATTSVSGIYFKSLETYCIAAVIYLILTYFSSLLMKAISKKLDTQAKDIPSSN
jgi:putative lysine transport system permease protein